MARGKFVIEGTVVFNDDGEPCIAMRFGDEDAPAITLLFDGDQFGATWSGIDALARRLNARLARLRTDTQQEAIDAIDRARG